MSFPPVAWRYARHATQTLNLLPQHISPNPAPPPSTPSTLGPAFFIIQSNLLLLPYVLLIEDGQLYANTSKETSTTPLIKILWETMYKYCFFLIVRASEFYIVFDFSNHIRSGVFPRTNTVSCGNNNKLRKLFPHLVPRVCAVDLSREGGGGGTSPR